MNTLKVYAYILSGYKYISRPQNRLSICPKCGKSVWKLVWARLLNFVKILLLFYALQVNLQNWSCPWSCTGDFLFISILRVNMIHSWRRSTGTSIFYLIRDLGHSYPREFVYKSRLVKLAFVIANPISIRASKCLVR